MAEYDSWTSSGSGSWKVASNWFDYLTLSPASVAPGVLDNAAITGPTTGAITVTGPGEAADLTINDNVTLAGTFALGSFEISDFPPNVTSHVSLVGSFDVINAVTIGSMGLEGGDLPTLWTDVGIVQVGDGSSLLASDVTVAAGTLQVIGGTVDIGDQPARTIGAYGVMTLGSILYSPDLPAEAVSSGSLDATGNANIHLGLLEIADGSVSIDPTSILEIGSANTAVAGTITVDPDGLFVVDDFVPPTATASISGPVFNNGNFDFALGTMLSEVTNNNYFDFEGNTLSDSLNNGELDFHGDALIDSVNNGTIAAEAGSLTAITGTGEILVAGSVSLGPNVNGSVDFLPFGTATLNIALGIGISISPDTTPPIAGFVYGDRIVLQGVSADTAQYNAAGTDIGTLTLDSAGTAVGGITLIGDYASATFTVSSSSGTSMITTSALACFAAGTRLLTRRGEVAVERLHAGDEVATLIGGGFRIIEWIGYRTVHTSKQPRPSDVLPVRIAAGAFSDGLPRRRLFLSPDHAVFVDSVLIPIRYLINGSTIAQISVHSIDYWHVELASHDVLFAEGLPAESYLDTGDRIRFANGGVVTALHPSFSALAWEAVGCAPLMVTGPVVDKVRQKLDRRARIIASRRTDRAMAML